MELGCVLLAIPLGLAVDWAFFYKMENAIGAFCEINDGFGYRDLLFPRVVITIISSAMLGFGVAQVPPTIWLLIVGTGMFLAANFYADYVVWRYGRRK